MTRSLRTPKPHEKGSLLHALNIQAGTLYDKERLERGQSTQNLSIFGKLITEAEAKLGDRSLRLRPALRAFKRDRRRNSEAQRDERVRVPPRQLSPNERASSSSEEAYLTRQKHIGNGPSNLSRP